MSHWYCQIGADVSGPMTLDDLQYLRDRGKITPRDLVRAGMNGDWLAAANYPELYSPSPPATQSVRATAECETAEPTTAMDAAEEPAADSAVRPPPLPAEPDSRRRRLLTGAGIGAAVLLLILLLVWLLMSAVGGSGGALAGYGVGDRPGAGVGGEEGAGEGGGKSDSTGANNESDGAVVFEGEVANDAPQTAAASSESPPEPTPAPQGMFMVQRLKKAQEQPPGGNGGGGGQGLGEFKNRLAREGGQSGEVQVTLIWHNVNDLDLHVACPSGETIWFQHRNSRCGGQLDVDMNANAAHLSTEPVENVFWPPGQSPRGEYRVYVDHYRNQGGRDPTSFRVAIKYGASTRTFSGTISANSPKRLVHTFITRESAP